jgi:hypothetical protein
MFYNNLRRAVTVLILIACQWVAAAPAPDAPILWIEAERFDNPGGWVNDSQFIDQMGSPYLLAAGMGKPVADAVTTIKAPAPGRYRLWARTRDWSPAHHPGTFNVIIDGKAVGLTRGDDALSTTKLRVVLGEPAGICEIRVYQEPQGVLEIARRATANQLLPDTDMAFPWDKKATD